MSPPKVLVSIRPLTLEKTKTYIEDSRKSILEVGGLRFSLFSAQIPQNQSEKHELCSLNISTNFDNF